MVGRIHVEMGRSLRGGSKIDMDSAIRVRLEGEVRVR